MSEDDSLYQRHFKAFNLNKLKSMKTLTLCFYIAGVDIHFNDRLGKLKISDEGVKQRDELSN